MAAIKTSLWSLLLLVLARATTALAPLSASNVVRRLEEEQKEEAQADDAAVDDYFQYDLADYSLRFEKCQYVKMYDDDLAQDEDSDSPLALKHFVLYKLCPTSSCSSTQCVEEDEAYGTYTIEVDTYLQYVVENQMRSFQNMCNNCQNNCANDDAGAEGEEEAEGDDVAAVADDAAVSDECSSCLTACEEYETLEENGYVDASMYIQCQQLELQNDDDDDNDDENLLYIGPRCTSDGKITIALFNDENCWDPADDLDVEEILGVQLSYMMLSHTSDSKSSCASCQEDPNDENQADAQDEDDVLEMCENLYASAAKCESPTGLDVGFVQVNRAEGDYENQVETENMACNFINSLVWKSYTEEGEIDVSSPQDEVIRYVTQKQAVSLSLLGLVIACLLAAAVFLDRKIKSVEQPSPTKLGMTTIASDYSMT